MSCSKIISIKEIGIFETTASRYLLPRENQLFAKDNRRRKKLFSRGLVIVYFLLCRTYPRAEG